MYRICRVLDAQAALCSQCIGMRRAHRPQGAPCPVPDVETSALRPVDWMRLALDAQGVPCPPSQGCALACSRCVGTRSASSRQDLPSRDTQGVPCPPSAGCALPCSRSVGTCCTPNMQTCRAHSVQGVPSSDVFPMPRMPLLQISSRCPADDAHCAHSPCSRCMGTCLALGAHRGHCFFSRCLGTCPMPSADPASDAQAGVPLLRCFQAAGGFVNAEDACSSCEWPGERREGGGRGCSSLHVSPSPSPPSLTFLPGASALNAL
ncbi:hypothetical protein NDU88_007427 [Pleurodeles waltl]|uniref:Uncharacterized protein n=1 Tax=Pleurodeles waltl TaxID=8319 RepID=A0AAV7MJ43_PLEWA|nr:hypothetical protein NDU88_007427 [Pleurodeles waltl]